MEKIRINKFLANCGLGSRRKVEEFISDGRVFVNGKRIDDFSTLVDPDCDCVKLGRKIVKPVAIKYYVLLNKPKGYITTLKDEENRPIIMDLLPEKFKRAGVVPVGRLDRDTEGLILLTNDGDLANKLIHPRYMVPKEYIVKINRELLDRDKKSLERGIFLDGKKTMPAKIAFLDESKALVKLTICEGKKRQIRIMFMELKYYVKKLKRVSLGPLKLDRLKSGDHRLLRKNEVAALKKYVEAR